LSFGRPPSHSSMLVAKTEAWGLRFRKAGIFTLSEAELTNSTDELFSSSTTRCRFLSCRAEWSAAETFCRNVHITGIIFLPAKVFSRLPMRSLPALGKKKTNGVFPGRGHFPGPDRRCGRPNRSSLPMPKAPTNLEFLFFSHEVFLSFSSFPLFFLVSSAFRKPWSVSAYFQFAVFRTPPMNAVSAPWSRGLCPRWGANR